jgi:DNA-binding NarL/FixJ family response regulator
MTRLLIADGQLRFSQRLRQSLERKHDIQVIGEASDASSTVKLTQQLKPDILLIDLALCQQSALLGLGAGSFSQQRTVVLLAGIEKDAIVEAFRFGAHGILPRTASPTVWRRTIRRVMGGQYCFEDGSVDVLLEAFRASFVREDESFQGDYRLTTRELEIVAKIAAGYSNREVGQHFSICERTVKHHLTNIFDKVGVASRLELALFAVQHRLAAAESVARRPVQDDKESRGSSHSAFTAGGTL